jgi:DNA primase
VSQIPKESIEQVLAATDIVDLVQSYVPLKRAAAQFRACCPFHNEKTPSFYVNPARQSFHCFGCGKGGDAISFVRDYENLPFVDAVRKLAQRAGVVIREEASDPAAERTRRSKGRLLDLHREASAFFHDRLMQSPGAEHAREYLKQRGYGRGTAVEWSIGWMPEQTREFLDWARAKGFSGRELVDSGICYLKEDGVASSGIRVRFRDRLMFPVRNEIGDVIAFSGRQLREDPNSGKYVNSPETVLFRKSRVLFALDRARKPILAEKSVLLCEGQLDVIACHRHGLAHAVAPLGTALTREHASLLRRYTTGVTVCYDADRAGLAATERVFRELAPEGLAVRVVAMPDGEDPDSLLKAGGPDAFRARVTAAEDFFEFKLSRAASDGLLGDAAGRATVLKDCAGLLSLMGDFAERENRINIVAARLQTSAASLRQAVEGLRKKNSKQRIAAAARAEAQSGAMESGESDAAGPTPVHRLVAYLCQLALHSPEAQHFLGEQFESLHEAAGWVEGIPLLEGILAAAPDPAVPASVNAYLATLPDADRLALADDSMTGAPEGTGIADAEQALARLSGLVLQKRDAAVKAALREPGLPGEELFRLLAEAEELKRMLSGLEQRSEFDDELPKSTWRPRPRDWRR